MVLAKLYTDLVRAEAWAEGWDKGYAEGWEKGYAEGWDKGYAEGKAEARAKIWAEGYAEGYARGFREGERRMMARWKGWNSRRLQAKQACQPFTEPEPGLEIAIDITRK